MKKTTQTPRIELRSVGDIGAVIYLCTDGGKFKIGYHSIGYIENGTTIDRPVDASVLKLVADFIEIYEQALINEQV